MSVDVHLVVGSTGAGKSTFARRLARSCGGVCFAVDEWMRQLFYPDRPAAAGYAWYAPRIERSTQMIWSLVRELVVAGTPSVLEIGLTQHAERLAFYQRVAQAGLSLKLYALDAPAELRWQRVERRNHERGETFALEVSREMFDFVEGMWQAPDDAELLAHAGQRIDTSATE